MSLLEDVFLQNEETEAQELERVIEGDEYEDQRPPRSDSDDNSEKGDEAEEDKRRVDPNTVKTKRIVKNPRFTLNPARLTGPRGIQIIPEHFKDFKLKGKGHEIEDLDLVLKKLEHWAYRLYPKFQFQDCLRKIEMLGKKRPVMVHLQKIRSDQFASEETVVQKDSSDEEQEQQPPEDEFDKLLQQQIELARSTPAPGSARKVLDEDRFPFSMPKSTSSPSISDEQKERMIRNRKLAEERRLAKLKQDNQINSYHINITNEVITEVDETPHKKKHNKSNVIESDSSDDECQLTAVNNSINVDIHMAIDKNDKEKSDDSQKNKQSERNVDDYVDEVLDLDQSPNNNEIDERNQLFNSVKDSDHENNIEMSDQQQNIETNASENVCTVSDEASKENIEKSKENTEICVSNNEKHENVNHEAENENINKVTEIDDNIKDNDEVLKATDQKDKSTESMTTDTVSNKENLDSNVGIDVEITDVMDVDFSDDF